jgi:hypothetical protein
VPAERIRRRGDNRLDGILIGSGGWRRRLPCNIGTGKQAENGNHCDQAFSDHELLLWRHSRR